MFCLIQARGCLALWDFVPSAIPWMDLVRLWIPLLVLKIAGLVLLWTYVPGGIDKLRRHGCYVLSRGQCPDVVGLPGSTGHMEEESETLGLYTEDTGDTGRVDRLDG